MIHIGNKADDGGTSLEEEMKDGVWKAGLVGIVKIVCLGGKLSYQPETPNSTYLPPLY
jgi:hypothetical protein